MRFSQAITALLSLLLPSFAAACWEAASTRYGVPIDLLHAVARVESGLNPKAVNRSHESRTGTRDIGLMQINTSHLRALARHGIDEASLYDPCLNLHIGAWLLAQSFSRLGTTWNAVGAYNAACDRLKGQACTRARSTYAWKVYRWLPAHETQQKEPQGKGTVNQLAAPTTPTHGDLPHQERTATATARLSDGQRLRTGSAISARIRAP